MATLLHHPATRPRTCANILADIREANADYLQAIGNYETDPDADSRATEAETRVEDLQAELAERFQEATGLSVEDWRKAYSEALI